MDTRETVFRREMAPRRERKEVVYRVYQLKFSRQHHITSFVTGVCYTVIATEKSGEYLNRRLRY